VTLKQALVRAREILAAKHIEDAPLESELLLRYTLKLDRAQLYLDLDRELTSEEAKTYWQCIDRRCQGEPSAYITGHRETPASSSHARRASCWWRRHSVWPRQSR
jgi:release factor glutamine methyltransferase